MKLSIFLVTGLTLFIAFTNFKFRQNKYLPVLVTMGDSSRFHSEIAFNIKAAFATRKIKVLSRKDAEGYIKSEATALAEGYLKSGGDIHDFDKYRQYHSTNMQVVANSLLLKISISQEGIINDTVMWDNHTIPINFEKPPKTKWHYIILDSMNAKTLLQMSQSIVDSIIASNVLVRE